MLTAFLMSLSVSFASEEVAVPTSSDGPSYKVQHSLGLSETMGPFGIYNYSRSRSFGLNEFYVVAGTSAIIFGGVGAGWKVRLRERGVTPYVTVTGSGIYMVPSMCQDCGPIRTHVFAIGSVGVELPLVQLRHSTLLADFGVMSIYNVSEWERFDSPSDIPAIWPAFNLKLRGKTEQ